MKKLLVITGLFLVVAAQVKAQKEILFKLQYLPNHTYSSVTKSDMNMEMNTVGDTAFINRMKKSGQTTSSIMQMQTSSKSETKTAAVNSAGDIPLVINASTLSLKMIMNGKEFNPPIPNITKTFYCRFTKDSKIELDSVLGVKMNDSVRNTMIKMIKKIEGDITLPNKEMKIGDTFVQTIPVDVPIKGIELKMLGKTTYKLMGIENNKAYFDTNMVVTMDMAGVKEGKKITVDMTGGGDGKMIFDIQQGYPIIKQNSINLVYSILMPIGGNNRTQQGKMNMLLDTQTTITAN
jgi:hypothetical protein